MPTDPKKLPTLRDSKDPQQLDVFQRDVRDVIRRVGTDLDTAETNIATAQTNITALQTKVNTLSAGAVVLPIAESDVTNLVADLAGKAALSHTHPESDVTGLVTDLANKSNVGHTHTEADVTGLTTDLASKALASRLINTTSPLSGGGDLTADRTLSIVANGISDSLLRQGAGLSVIGRSSNIAGNVSDIAAVADGDILRVAAGVLGFGAVPESSVTGLTTDLANRPTGSGTLNRITKFTGTNTVGNSNITDDGTNIIHGATALTKTGVGPYEFTKDAGNNLTVSSYGTGVNSQVFMLRGRGTAAATTAILSGDVTGQVSFAGATGASGFSTGAIISAIATENYGANFGTKLTFTTTQNALGSGGRAVRLTIDNDGTATFTNGIVGNSTLGITGLSTLTGGFTLGADSSAGSHKITSLANGTAASDAAAFGQIGTAVNAAVTGTSGHSARFTGTNAVGNGAFTDDGTNVTLSGTAALTSTAGNTLSSTYSGTAQTTDRAAANVVSAGTFDTTAAVHTSYGVIADSHSTRSAGTNTLTNVGLYATATGGQVNKGLWVASGDAQMDGNVTLGNSTSDAHALNGTLNANGTPGTNNQVLQIISGIPEWSSISTAGGALGAGINGKMALWSSNTTLTSSGYLGEDSLAQRVYVSGGNGFQSTSNGGPDAGVAGLSAPTGFAGNIYGVVGNGGGSLDATAAARSAYAGSFDCSTTRSAGTNAVTNYGVYANAQGAQTNYALYTYTGDVFLNGFGAGGGSANSTTIGGNVTAQQALTVNRSTYFGSQASDGCNVRGSLYVTGDGAASAIGTTTTHTGYAAATWGTKISLGGTIDATGAARSSKGIESQVTTTRSAGANNVTNYAAYLDSSGAQVNYALYTYQGDVVLNGGSGTTTINGALTCASAASVNGNVTLGDASTDAHTLNGNLTFSNTPTAGPIKYGTANARLYLGRQVLKTGSTSPYTPTTGTKAIMLRMVGGGGAGGGAVGGASSLDAGSGGGSGAYIEKWLDPGTTITGGAFSIGAGGTGVTGGTGNNGGDTTITIQGTLFTAKGGSGGNSMGTGSVARPAYPWGPQAGSGTNAAGTFASAPMDFEGGGNSEPGLRFSTSFGNAGCGGSNPLGVGGLGFVVGATNGNAGRGYGSGGSGSGATTTSTTGGAGTAGLIIIDEYA